MSNAPTATASPSVLRRILRVIAIVLVFVLLGPPIGGVSLITMLAIVNMGTNISPSDYATVVQFALIYGSAFAYLFGVLPAAAVGLIVGVWQVFLGRLTWPVALSLGTIAGIALMKFIERGGVLSRDHLSYRPIVVLTCVLPTMACWLVVHMWFLHKQSIGRSA